MKDKGRKVGDQGEKIMGERQTLFGRLMKKLIIT